MNTSKAHFTKGQTVFEARLYDKQLHETERKVIVEVRSHTVLACGKVRLLVEKDGHPRGYKLCPNAGNIYESEQEALDYAFSIAQHEIALHEKWANAMKENSVAILAQRAQDFLSRRDEIKIEIINRSA